MSHEEIKLQEWITDALRSRPDIIVCVGSCTLQVDICSDPRDTDVIIIERDVPLEMQDFVVPRENAYSLLGMVGNAKIGKYDVIVLRDELAFKAFISANAIMIGYSKTSTKISDKKFRAGFCEAIRFCVMHKMTL